MTLVISIIVLLILATVSINLIINNGILDKAKLAVDKYSEGEELEQIQLDVLSAQMKNKLTTESLNIELQKILNNDKEVTEYSDYFFYKTNKSYRIYKDGKVEEGTLLPDEFQQVEYIESTGTQYIDTNTKYFDIGSIQIDFLLTKIAGTVFGHNCAGREVLLFYQGGKASYINGTNYTYEAPQKNHKYNVVFDITNGNASLTIDGNLVGTSTGSSN